MKWVGLELRRERKRERVWCEKGSVFGKYKDGKDWEREREEKGGGKKMDGTTMGLNRPKRRETLNWPFLFFNFIMGYFWCVKCYSK